MRRWAAVWWRESTINIHDCWDRAIAYQFGLTKSGLDSSFRFIAIDEAFRAQDEDKARYLISLANNSSAVARGDSERQYSHRGERYFVCALCGAQGQLFCAL